MKAFYLKVYTIILFFASISISLSQGNLCKGYTVLSSAQVSTLSCSTFFPGAMKKYQNQATYTTTTNSSLITLKLVVHVVTPRANAQNNWNNSNNNYNGLPALQYLMSKIQNQTERYSAQPLSNFSVPNFTFPFVYDTKVNYEVVKYYFYPDSQLYYRTLNGLPAQTNTALPNYNPTIGDKTYIGNYIYANYPSRIEEGYPVIISSDGNFCTGTCVAGSYSPGKDSATKILYSDYNARNLRHELGHAFGLNHTYWGGNYSTGTATNNYNMSPSPETLTCTNLNYLSDVFPINNPNAALISYPNCPNPPSTIWNNTYETAGDTCNSGINCTNNFMSDNSVYGDTRWISPLQVGRKRKNMHLAPTDSELDYDLRKYAKEVQSSYFGRWIITGNETWDFNIQMYEDIEIKAGATLKIRCTTAMATDGKIIVNKGAKLIIDGGEVTGWCKKTPNVCNNNLPLWMGIQVVGDPNVFQYINSNGYSNTAGIVEIKNAGKISYAQNGIFTCYSSPWGDFIPNNTSGGIVISNGGVFENNIRDIVMFNNQVGVTASKIINSKFITKGLIGVDGNNNIIKPAEHIKLYKNVGLIFKGDTFQYAAGSTYQPSDRGIGIYSTDSQFNTDASVVGSHTYRNQFQNLTQGIYIDNVNPLYSVYIFNSDFNNQTLRSVTSENQNNLLFMDNNISNTQMYLYKTKYYTIKNNNFYGYFQNAGIIAHQSGTGAHQIYKNNFTNWRVGILAQENNGSILPNGNGLKMNCNDFTFSGGNNIYDIALTKSIEPMPLVMANQSPPNPINPTALETVRNIYGANFNGSSAAKNKWFVDASNTQTITHNYPASMPATNPNNPQIQASSQINLNQLFVNFIYSSDCKKFPPSSGNISSSGSGSGNLADMNNYITAQRTSNESGDRDFEIQATVSSKLNYFLNDTTLGSADSVVAILNSNQGNMDDADIQLIFAYLKKKDFTSATTKINNLPNNRSDWKELLLKVKEVEQDSMEALCLITNTALANYFAAYANSEGKDGQAVAQALMRFAFGTEHDYPIILPPVLGGRAAHETNTLENKLTENTIESDFVKIYPNPTQKGINVLYNGNEEANLKLEIRDLLGRLIYANFIIKKETMYLPLNELQNGVYTLSIKKANEKIIYQNKLIKQD